MTKLESALDKLWRLCSPQNEHFMDSEDVPFYVSMEDGTDVRISIQAKEEIRKILHSAAKDIEELIIKEQNADRKSLALAKLAWKILRANRKADEKLNFVHNGRRYVCNGVTALRIPESVRVPVKTMEPKTSAKSAKKDMAASLESMMKYENNGYAPIAVPKRKEVEEAISEAKKKYSFAGWIPKEDGPLISADWLLSFIKGMGKDATVYTRGQTEPVIITSKDGIHGIIMPIRQYGISKRIHEDSPFMLL